MKIQLTSVMVDDQDKALAFYAGILGFVKKQDVPIGEYKWLTVVSPDGPGDVELLLEPIAFEPARVFQRALYDAGIAAAAFAVDDIHAEHARLRAHGVVFRSAPEAMGPVVQAVFEDTCGNLIQLYQAE
jgi:catechol 2,3-dioxygenase-like lactoylglutathione lyase family enzyme